MAKGVNVEWQKSCVGGLGKMDDLPTGESSSVAGVLAQSMAAASVLLVCSSATCQCMLSAESLLSLIHI